MAEIFIVRRWIKSAMLFVGVAFLIVGAFAYQAYGKAHYAGEEAPYQFSLVMAGALLVAWILLLISFFVSPWIVNPQRARRGAPYKQYNIPYWWLGVVGLVLCIGGLGIYNWVESARLLSPYDLLRKGKLEALEVELEKNPDLVNKLEGGTGPSMLMMAVQLDNRAAIELLMDRGADVSVQDTEGRGLAIFGLRDAALLQVMIEAGVALEGLDYSGNAAIHYAVARKDRKAVEMLLAAGVSVDLLNGNKLTPLLMAIGNGSEKMVAQLIAAGADVNAEDRQGNSALHMAVASRNKELVALLLNKGARPVSYNFDELSAIHMAARLGEVEILQLFEGRVDPVRLVNRRDLSPFDLAVARRKYDAADHLLEAGADINRIRRDRNTLFQTLLLEKNYSPLEYLIEKGADIDIRGAKGQTAREIMEKNEMTMLLDRVRRRDHVAEEESTNSVEQVERATDA